MSIRLKQRGSNQTILDFGDAGEVLFSYETPVAGRHPRIGMVACSQKSPTTSKHVNAYVGTALTNMVPPQFFDEWLADIGDVEQATEELRLELRDLEAELDRAEVTP